MTRPDPKVLFRILLSHLGDYNKQKSARLQREIPYTFSPPEKDLINIEANDIALPKVGDIINIVSIDYMVPMETLDERTTATWTKEKARIVDVFRHDAGYAKYVEPVLTFQGIAEYVDCSEDPLFDAIKIW